MTWVRVNDDTGAAALGVRTVGGDRKIAVFTDASLVANTPAAYLNGVWANDAAAQEAINELVDAVDPSTYGD